MRAQRNDGRVQRVKEFTELTNVPRGSTLKVGSGTLEFNNVSHGFRDFQAVAEQEAESILSAAAVANVGADKSLAFGNPAEDLLELARHGHDGV